MTPDDNAPAVLADLHDWTIRVLAPAALQQADFHHEASTLADLPRWAPRIPGARRGPHLDVCKASYFTLDTYNNAHWQTHTTRTRSDGSLRPAIRGTRPPGPTADTHELAELLGPAYFFATAIRITTGPGARPGAAYYAYTASALAYQVNRRRGHILDLRAALHTPTYRQLPSFHEPTGTNSKQNQPAPLAAHSAMTHVNL